MYDGIFPLFPLSRLLVLPPPRTSPTSSDLTCECSVDISIILIRIINSRLSYDWANPFL